jgi:hypothetical protein
MFLSCRPFSTYSTRHPYREQPQEQVVAVAVAVAVAAAAVAAAVAVALVAMVPRPPVAAPLATKPQRLYECVYATRHITVSSPVTLSWSLTCVPDV